MYGFVESGTNTLEGVRGFLERIERGIIIGLQMRADYRIDIDMYRPGLSKKPGFDGSEFERLFRELLFAQERGLKIADELPFFPDQPPPRQKPVQNRYPNGPSKINLNGRIMTEYIQTLPDFCVVGDDGGYVYAAAADASVLDLLSARIHRGGIWVADIKFSKDPYGYRRLLEKGDENAKDDVMHRITDISQEGAVLARVFQKAEDLGCSKPDFVLSLYRNHVIPLTKEVQFLRMREVVEKGVGV